MGMSRKRSENEPYWIEGLVDPAAVPNILETVAYQSSRIVQSSNSNNNNNNNNYYYYYYSNNYNSIQVYSCAAPRPQGLITDIAHTHIKR